MPNEKNKYLEDEQVKKNLDMFKNDKENFMNDSEHLDNIGLYYEKNKNIDIVKPKDGLVKKEELYNNNENLEKRGENDKVDEHAYIGVPVIISFLSIVFICYLTFIAYGDGSGFNGLSIMYLWAIPYILVVIWLSYCFFNNILFKGAKFNFIAAFIFFVFLFVITVVFLFAFPLFLGLFF